MTPAGAVEADAAVIGLRQSFAQALETYEAARLAFNRCESRFFRELPRPPAVLTKNGPLGYLLTGRRAWWDAAELRGLLRDSDRRAVWREARAALPTAKAHAAKISRLRRKAGVAAAQAAHEAAIDALDELGRRALASPTRSPAGLAVKAQIVKTWGKPEWWNAEMADPCESLAAQILDAIIADGNAG